MKGRAESSHLLYELHTTTHPKCCVCIWHFFICQLGRTPLSSQKPCMEKLLSSYEDR